MAIRIGGRRGPAMGGRGGSFKVRLIIAAVLLLVAVGGYFLNVSPNKVTGEDQRVGGITEAQEVALGLQAAPEMAQQFGGVSANSAGDALVKEIGRKLVAAIPVVYSENIDSIDQIPYEFTFTLLDDDQVVNAFALPGGPTFITDALFDRLTEGQVAGVMGHEIGHVIHRHGVQRMAKQNLLQGVAGAVTVGAGDQGAGQAALMVGNFLQMKYGRDQELQSDREGVLLMVEAGYDPRSMITVMRVLKEASGGASGPEWASTHPDPENREARLEQIIAELFPNGVPEGLVE